MTDLKSKRCIPCEKGVDPLDKAAVDALLLQVPGWSVSADYTSIVREFTFKDFVEGIVFMTDVAHVAEEEGHHPDMNIHDYNKVTITLSTHAIKGLSENDFILAAKINEV